MSVFPQFFRGFNYIENNICCREGPVKDTNTTVYHVSKIILTSTSEQTFSTFIHTCKQDR